MDPQLKRLGRTVVDGHKELLDGFDLEGQRTRFLLQALARPRRRGYAGTVAAAAFAIVLLVVISSWRTAGPLRFRVAGAPGREGERITAPASSALPLVFSDGSRVLLAARSGARVDERSERGAHIVLERGSLAAHITHREHTQWRVDAGPFRVHVVGTAFELSWRDERLALRIDEGAVRVVGPQLGAPRHVVTGERLEIDLASGARSPAVQGEPTTSAPPVTSPLPSLSAADGAAQARAIPSWRALAAAGAHEQAFQRILREGFERLMRTGSAADLALVADLARFGGHDAQARSALLALRARFAGTPASNAAFALGRLAFDRRGTQAEASRWFEVYLNEAPDGVFEREAAGRLIECYQQLEDGERGARAARRYLAAFPSGPHARLARSLLGATDGAAQ